MHIEAMVGISSVLHGELTEAVNTYASEILYVKEMEYILRTFAVKKDGGSVNSSTNRQRSLHAVYLQG